MARRGKAKPSSATAHASPIIPPSDLLPLFKQIIGAGLVKQCSMDADVAMLVADRVTMGRDAFPFDVKKLTAAARNLPPPASPGDPPVDILSAEELSNIGKVGMALAASGGNAVGSKRKRASADAGPVSDRARKHADGAVPQSPPRIVEIGVGADPTLLPLSDAQPDEAVVQDEGGEVWQDPDGEPGEPTIP